MDARSGEPTWDLEREVVIARVIDAPRELVFEAWTNADHIAKWFGPNGFACTTHEIDIRAGGRWRFDMIGPDGKVYPSRMVFLEVKHPERLVFDHGLDQDDDPGKFRVTVTFDQQQNGKTVVTLRQLHPTAERRKVVIGFGAVELGYQTLGKLAEHVAALRG